MGFSDDIAIADADLLEYFAQSATYTQADGTAVALSVVFHEAQGEKDSEQYGQVKRRSGQVGFKTADLGASPAIDEKITISSETWNVTRIVSIEHGWATVNVTKAAAGDRIQAQRTQRGDRSLR